MRIGVIGAGHMGRLHAGKVAELAAENTAVSLAGVADTHPERARALASSLGAAAAPSSDALLAQSDAVIVAVPTIAHHAVVRAALAAGCDVLVEKPIAASVEEGEALLAQARAAGRILQVGHLEWFNSAMGVIRSRITRPRFVEAHRMGPFSDRATDIDVVRDLMIHDLEILQQILGEEPCRVEAIGIPVLSANIDIANARVTYPGGCVANLTASRVSPTPMRKLRFFQNDGYFSVDFLEQTAVVFRREPARDGEAPRIEMEKLEVDRGDALMTQLRAFVEAVATRKSCEPSGGGDGALGALRTALQLVEAMPAIEELE
ncbi:MAG: Gfo/Idh/MocA family protein [Myxococcota bacterium]